MSGGAAVIHKQNKYMNLFSRSGAIDAEHAISLAEIGCRESFVFRRMVSRGVFIPCGNERYYMDNQAAIRFKEQRRIRALLALITLFIVFVILYKAGILKF